MKNAKSHAITSIGTVTLAVAVALGVSACSDTGTTTPTESSASAAVTSPSAVASTASPAAATIVPPPLIVTSTDTAITLVPGQLAEWVNSSGANRALVLSSDQDVFTGVPRNPGDPLMLRAVGAGVAVARVYIDSTIPVQVLNVTVTAD